MKILHTAAIVLLSVLAIAGAKPWTARGNLHAYFEKIGQPLDIEYLQEVVDHTDAYARRLCLQGETDTLLALMVTESALQLSFLGDDGRSFGLGQVLTKDAPAYRAFWAKRGVKIPADKGSAETQVALCVAAFAVKLRDAKGDVWQACRRYNGRGQGAKRHAKKVMKYRAEIFGRPYTPGENRGFTECGRNP